LPTAAAEPGETAVIAAGWFGCWRVEPSHPAIDRAASAKTALGATRI
jgi:hypothetical protein